MKCSKCKIEIKDHSDTVEVIEKKKLWFHWLFGWNHKTLKQYHLDCWNKIVKRFS